MRQHRQADIEEVVQGGFSSSLVAASFMNQLGGWKNRLQVDETQDPYGNVRWSVIRMTEDYVRRTTGPDADAELVGTNLFVRAHGPRVEFGSASRLTDQAIALASCDLARFPDPTDVRAVYTRLLQEAHASRKEQP